MRKRLQWQEDGLIIEHFRPGGRYRFYFCFDSRGIHAGSLCREGCRVALVTGFRPPAALRLNPRQFRDPRPLGSPWERDPEEWREWRGWQA